jgi:hypothetical protein
MRDPFGRWDMVAVAEPRREGSQGLQPPEWARRRLRGGECPQAARDRRLPRALHDINTGATIAHPPFCDPPARDRQRLTRPRQRPPSAMIRFDTAGRRTGYRDRLSQIGAGRRFPHAARREP